MFKTDLNKGMGENETPELDLFKSEELSKPLAGDRGACRCSDRDEAGHGCVIRP